MKACEIRLRAERRAGQLLSEMEKAKAGRPLKNPSHEGDNFQPTKGEKIAAIGVSKKQAENWQRLAAAPEDRFERAFDTTQEAHAIARRKTIYEQLRPETKHGANQHIERGVAEFATPPAERFTKAIARRKTIYEQLHPETKHGAVGNGRNAESRVADSATLLSERFTKAIAEGWM